jgi:outer membrane protein TolC
MRLGLLLLLAVTACGCTRAYYRRSADRESYGATEERDHDPRWDLPHIAIDPPPASRLHDPFSPDFPPLPPDDPPAYRYMVRPNGIHGYRRWHKDGDAPWIEDPSWLDGLKRVDDGTLVLTPEYAVELGLLDSREYQSQLEQLYLTALALTLNRFEFDLHWFLTNSTTYTHFGSSADELNTLNTTSNFGFQKAFAAGGQLAVDLANTFVFTFSGVNHTVATSNIMINFIQPLLRHAGRNVRLESLTEAERNLLYQVRTFAHFRKQFTFQVATNSYLQLLSQEQQLRNSQANLTALEQSYRLHEALFAAGTVSTVKVDQVYQSLEAGKLTLIQTQASLDTALDNYKFELGLPITIPIHLDDSLLAPFELNDPSLTKFQAAADKFLAEYRELDQAPTVGKLEEGFRQLKSFQARVPPLVEQIGREMGDWKKKLAVPDEDKDRARREQAAYVELTKELEDTRNDLAGLAKAIDKSAAGVTEQTRPKKWEELQDRARGLSAAVAQLFVIQTQVRVYLVKLREQKFEEAAAIREALDNRLDLMNQQALVVDAWRQIGITANALEAGLDVVTTANISTLGSGNPIDFRASASSYSVGFAFDGPLNRVAERNAYRASQIAFEAARRQYIALQDGITSQIRRDLRALETARLSFEIARQSLISAARQVESAREELLFQGKDADPTSTQNILNALNSVLSSKNSLIASWVSYETGRIQLLLDLEALQVNDRGLYTDGQQPQSDQLSADGAAGNAPQPGPAKP